MPTFLPLSERVSTVIAGNLRTKLGIGNRLALPRIEKVTVNVGINSTKMAGKEWQEYLADSLAKITGQRPSFRTTQKSISNFKIREGLVVGAKVTLRGKRMLAFLDRLIHIALPRVRDFRGLPKRLDGRGNMSIGIRDHSIFPEVPPPDAQRIFGLEITVSTSAGDDTTALALLQEIGLPFQKEERRTKAPAT